MGWIGGVFGGIAGNLSNGLTAPQALLKAYPHQQYFPLTVKPKGLPVQTTIVRDLARDTYTVKTSWLDYRVERVAQRGREWLTGNRLSVKETKVDGLAFANNPPSVKGREVPWEGSQSEDVIYTRRLLNGDHVYVHPKDSDWSINGV